MTDSSQTAGGGGAPGNAAWYKNPSDVLASRVWKDDYPDLDVTIDGATGDVVSMSGCAYRRDKHGNPVVMVLSDTTDPPDDEVSTALTGIGEVSPGERLPGAPELWKYVVSNPDADAVEIARALNTVGIPASPDYEVFPLPGRMYFPGNLASPSDNEIEIMDLDVDAPAVHVLDTGLVPGLGLPANIQGNGVADDDDRLLGHSIVVGHGTFVAGVIAQLSPSRVVSWAVPEDGTSRFYETDVLDVAARLRESAGPGPTITNLSLGTVVCRHGMAERREPWRAVPLVTLFGTATKLTENGSVLVAAAGNTHGFDVATYPAAFTSKHHAPKPIWSPDPAPPPIERSDDNSRVYELIEDRRAAVGERIVAVGADDLAGAGEEYSTTAYWVSTFRDGCHDSFFPSGRVTYTDQRNPEQLPEAPLHFVPAPGNGKYAFANWCGTSFATAVVSAEIANEVIQDPAAMSPAQALLKVI